MEKITDPKTVASFLDRDSVRAYFTDDILEDAHIIIADHGEQIILQGEQPRNLYFMLQGKCSIHAYLSNGRKVILSTVDEPSLLGEIELLNRKPANFSVTSVGRTVLAVFPLDTCGGRLLDSNRFLRQLCLVLTEKETSNSKGLIHTSGFPLINRLAGFILRNSDGTRFTVRKTEIADTLGVSFRHLSKVMADLVEEGTLEKDRLTYYIRDRAALTELAAVLHEN